MLRTALAAAVIAALALTAALAAANSGLLRAFFRGDSQALEDRVKRPYASVSDGIWTLTVEEVLADPCQALVTFSIEALTAEAAAELNRADFFDMDTLQFSAGTALTGGIGDIGARNTPTKRYYHMELAYSETPGPLRLRLGAMEEGLTVSLAPDVDTVELDMEQTAPMLRGQDCTVRQVMVSPIGMRLLLEVPAQRRNESIFAQALLVTAGGEVLTPSALTGGHGQSTSGLVGETEDTLTYEIIWRFDRVLDLSELAGILVGDRLYDPAAGTDAPSDLGAAYRPFEIASLDIHADGNPYFSLEELCAGLGAAYTWDAADRTAEVTCRGNTVAVPALEWGGEVLTDASVELGAGLGVGVRLSHTVTFYDHAATGLTWFVFP